MKSTLLKRRIVDQVLDGYNGRGMGSMTGRLSLNTSLVELCGYLGYFSCGKHLNSSIKELTKNTELDTLCFFCDLAPQVKKTW